MQRKFRCASSHIFWLAILSSFAVGIWLSFIVPIWSPIDEASHFDLIVQYATGHYPSALHTAITPVTHKLDLSHPTGAASYASIDPRKSTVSIPNVAKLVQHSPSSIQRAWFKRHLWMFSSEAFETPGYYLLMVPIYDVAHSFLGALGSVYVLRLINVLMIAATAWVAYATFRLLRPHLHGTAVLVGVLVGILPGFVISSVQITNHTFLVLIVSAFIYLLLSAFRQGLNRKRFVLICILAALAPLATLTGVIYLVPAAVAVLLQQTWKLKSRVLLIVGMLASAAVPLVVWATTNKVVLGVWIQPQGYPSNFLIPSFQLHSLVPFIVGSLENVYLQFFLGQFLTYNLLYFGILLLTLPATLLLFSLRPHVVSYCWKRLWSPQWILLLGSILVTLAFAVFDQVLSNRAFAALGRFLDPAVVPIALTLAIIGTHVLSRPLRFFFGGGAVLGCMLGIAALPQALTVSFASQPIAYLSPGSLTQPTFLSATASIPGMVVIRLDQAARDTRGRLWFHILAANPGPSEVSWYPQPEFLTASGATISSHSSQCNVDIPPDSSCSEWVLIGNQPSLELRSITHVVFRDVIVLKDQRIATLSAQVHYPNAASPAYKA